MIRRCILFPAFLLLAAGLQAAQHDFSPADSVAVTEAIAPSLVRVEYTLQFDKGERPVAGAAGERCPNCGRYHGYAYMGAQLVEEERPLEVAGFLLSPTKVVTSDLMIHPRFLKKIAVRFGEQIVDARITAYAKEYDAAFLELARPLEGASPLVFDAQQQAPYLALSYGLTNGAWTTSVAGLSVLVKVTETNRRSLGVPSACVIVAGNGTHTTCATFRNVPGMLAFGDKPLPIGMKPKQFFPNITDLGEQRRIFRDWHTKFSRTQFVCETFRESRLRQNPVDIGQEVFGRHFLFVLFAHYIQ